MGVKTMEAHARYLGLPAMFGRSKKVVFAQVIDKVWKKVKGWKEKVLSREGKKVLIKSVAQEIPTYVMGCFRLPNDCCKEIEALLARFWWGSSKKEKRIDWRLMTGSSSLLERVFKTHYYPRTSISEDKLGYTSRYA
ncbi:unnamed protein product [Vicia faba]|uniref:Uncharacterized protein n=1 Tax=Vicia faba TaxID=3906 RepID=A0AAV0YR56_VICFA|nr:unnamed protein product [Vicia faba]